jgi:hypothetical protein
MRNKKMKHTTKEGTIVEGTPQEIFEYQKLMSKETTHKPAQAVIVAKSAPKKADFAPEETVREKRKYVKRKYVRRKKSPSHKKYVAGKQFIIDNANKPLSYLSKKLDIPSSTLDKFIITEFGGMMTLRQQKTGSKITKKQRQHINQLLDDRWNDKQ